MRDMTIIKEIFPEFEEEKIAYAKAYAEAAAEKATNNNNITSIRNLMDTLKFSAAQAMDALKIPESLREEYASRL